MEYNINSQFLVQVQVYYHRRCLLINPRTNTQTAQHNELAKHPRLIPA